jgi:hypothetical protein
MASWYVRAAGAETNGGSSASLTPDRSGTDMGVTNGDATVTSATGAFVAGDVGKGICIATVLYKIVTVNSSTSIEVDRVYAAATGTNKAWAIGGARSAVGTLVASPVTVVADGDTVYVGAGTYRVSATIAPTSHGAATFLTGDVDGSITGDAGEVVVTTFTSDTSAPSAVDALTLASKNYWTIAKMTFQGGGANYPIRVSGTSQYVTLQDLTLYQPLYLGALTFATVSHFIIERCRVIGDYGGIYVLLSSSSSGADFDADILIRNCVVQGIGYSVGVNIDAALGSTKKPGGVTVANCTLFGGNTAVVTLFHTAISTTYPVKAYNNLLLGSNGISAVTAGTIVEDYNVLIGGGTMRTNCSAGAHSISDYSRNPRFSITHQRSYGGTLRPWGEPVVGSPLLGFGANATPTVSDDITGAPRPGSGNASVAKALGAYERSNTGTRSTAQYNSSPASVLISGPGYHDLPLVVRSGSHTITAYMRYDSNYAGDLPTLGVVNGGECGVADAHSHMAGAADTWEAVTLAITPTADGIVTVRMSSLSTAAAGLFWFDDMSVS